MPQLNPFAGSRFRFVTWYCALVALAVFVWTTAARAQFPPLAATANLVPAPTVLPEPIYWKQNLFLIPYQWSSAADPSAAQAVWLLVSKDRGASWQKISEAKPQVKAFNYHAQGDGEYWFALRTIDRTGQQQPPGPYQPELRVVVDTTMPKVESLTAEFRSDGALQIDWRASDANIDADSWRFEVQMEGADTWQPLAGLAIIPAANAWQAAWQPPPGARPRALRATVYDRAGNSAAYGAAITGTPLDRPAVNNVASAVLPNAPQGWTSATASTSTTVAAPSAAAQPWPATTIAGTPFRLSNGMTPTSGDHVTSYGNPQGVGTPLASSASRVVPDPEFPANSAPNITPLEPYRESTAPFRQASLARLPSVDGAPTAPVAAPPASAYPAAPTIGAAFAPRHAESPLPPGAEAKQVGSRTFALEYELEDFGRGGIAKVELWGTRDGGQTWRLFATDDDHRSPLVVTVDDAGRYGFRIVVESAGGAAAFPPRAGDMPELWVDVDLNQPVAELTSVELGEGNESDHLIVRWRAEDDNLDERPIALFYSSRPAGPWTAVATSLANTGQYAWQIQRHLPNRFYMRLEARDAAGNLAAFQTREPIIMPDSQPTARLRDAEPIGPTSDYR